jgi:cell division protein FtsB
MPKPDEIGFTVTPAKASFLVTLTVLAGVFWQGVSYVQANSVANITQNAQIEQNRKDIGEFKQQTKELTVAIVDLRDQVVKLTAVYEATKDLKSLPTALQRK